MDMNEAIQRTQAAGYGGLMLWSVGANYYMGCLITVDFEPDHSTNLWDYVPTANEALIKLVENAERRARK